MFESATASGGKDWQSEIAARFGSLKTRCVRVVGEKKDKSSLFPF
jgi:hypothetical protein